MKLTESKKDWSSAPKVGLKQPEALEVKSLELESKLGSEQKSARQVNLSPKSEAGLEAHPLLKSASKVTNDEPQ